MLTDVEPIIGRVDEVSVIKDILLLKESDGVVDNLVNRLQGPESITVVFVIFINLCVVELFQLAYPINSAWLYGIVNAILEYVWAGLIPRQG